MAVFCKRVAGLPVGVVPAAVLGVSGHPPAWAAYTSTTSQNPAAAAAAYPSAQLAYRSHQDSGCLICPAWAMPM